MRGALLLESIKDVIKTKHIHDGQVIISAGSIEQCTYHLVAMTAQKSPERVQNPERAVRDPQRQRNRSR